MRAEPPLEHEPDGAGRRGRGRPPSPGIDRRILDAALELLASGGYAGFRLDELAKRASGETLNAAHFKAHLEARYLA